MTKKSSLHSFKQKSLSILDGIVSLILILVALRLVIYMATSLFVTVQDMTNGDMWLTHKDDEILHWMVYFIVMVKAYKVLIDYAKHHLINLKKVTELVIVTSFIELIFQMHQLELFQVVSLGAIGVTTLIVYLFYYDRFVEMSCSFDNDKNH